MAALESVYTGTKDPSPERIRIENEIRDSMSRLSDEQLRAIGEWSEERVTQEQRVLHGLNERLAELEAELARRKRG